MIISQKLGLVSVRGFGNSGILCSMTSVPASHAQPFGRGLICSDGHDLQFWDRLIHDPRYLDRWSFRSMITKEKLSDQD